MSAYSNANIGSRWCYWFHCLYHVVCSYSLARYRIERWASLSFCWASNIVWTFDDSNVNHLNYITLIVLVAWNYEINQERNEYDDSANCDESVTIQVLSYDCCLEKCLSFPCTEIRYLCEIFSKPMQFNKFRRYVCDIIFNVFFLPFFLCQWNSCSQLLCLVAFHRKAGALMKPLKKTIACITTTQTHVITV